MTEEKNELLKEKLKLFFEERIEKLTNKFTNDINLIEELKYNIYENIIIPYREIKEKKEENEKSKESEKEKEKEKEKETKKVEEQKEPKANHARSIKTENINLTKTPMKSNRKKELDFKGKTEAAPKKSRVFSGKASRNSELNQTFQNDRVKKKSNVALTEANKKTIERTRSSRTPFNKKEKAKDKEEKKEKESKPKKSTDLSRTAYKPSGTKRFTNQKKTIEKKGKPEKQENKKKEIKKQIKKVSIKNHDKKEKTEDKVEKKFVVNFKGINPIPEELKNKNALYNIYLIIKGNYLSNKENYKLVLSHPLIYKSFGNDAKFLLNDTKKDLQSKIFELENFLNKYDDLPNIISQEFQPSKSAMKSLMFVKKEELENLIKKGNVIKEFCDIIKILLYLLDIKFDENLSGEELLQFFISEVLDKNNNQNLLKLVSDFLAKNKSLNLTKEKVDKIEDIIKSDEAILSISDMTKKNRNMSYCTLLIKEFHEFITLKTSDDIPYYELKNKDTILKEYKYKLATIENNGIPPKKEEEKKEEGEEINADNEKKEEANNENKDNLQENKDKEIEQNKVETQDNQTSQLGNQKVEEQNVKNENNE